jgi:D-mannonate dehydratase
VPVAEKAGVKLAMHPDDPPLSPIRGVGRIMRSIDNYQRLVDLVPSPVNGITLCQGNFTLMTSDLPSVIRKFGAQKKIFFVHFRDVRGTVEKFEETWHDAGQTDLLACMRAYRGHGWRLTLHESPFKAAVRPAQAQRPIDAHVERCIAAQPALWRAEERIEDRFGRGADGRLKDERRARLVSH